jgi:hypothetical protein
MFEIYNFKAIMKIFDILKQRGLFSNDIKDRIKRKQIFINNDIVESNLDLNIELDINNKAIIIESGEFLYDLLGSDLIKSNQNFITLLEICGFESLFDSNIKNELTNKLNKFIIIRTSKKETFLLEKSKDNHKLYEK